MKVLRADHTDTFSLWTPAITVYMPVGGGERGAQRGVAPALFEAGRVVLRPHSREVPSLTGLCSIRRV